MKMLATLGEGKIFDLLRNETEKIRSSITQLTNLKKLTSWNNRSAESGNFFSNFSKLWRVGVKIWNGEM